MKKIKWKKYVLEFISIFIAVVAAFSLDNWNDNRKDNQAGAKILLEMSNGLNNDISDIENNISGHRSGIRACDYWRNVINKNEFNGDSLNIHYTRLLRGFYPVQNKSGYETLKSKGLELIHNDSLRLEILDLYEYYYYILKMQEENSTEMQFEEMYSHDILKILSKSFEFSEMGNLVNLSTPINFTENEKKLMLTYLMNIEMNRKMMIKYYVLAKDKIDNLRDHISAEIKR